MLPRLAFATSVVLASGLCCGLPGPSSTPSGPPAGETRYVVSASTLKLRAAPSTSSATLTELPRGATVIVTGPASGSETASGIHGAWVPAWYAGQAGYVFDGFLLSFPPPPLGCTSIEQWSTVIGVAGPERSISKTKCADMGIGENDICDETKRTPLNGQAYLQVNAGYEWGGQLIHLPGVSADAAWAAARQCFTGAPNLSGEGLPTASGIAANLHADDAEVNTIVDGAIRGWDYSEGCSQYVRITTSGADVDIEAGGGC